MPQLSMSLWLAAVQLALVPVTEATILKESVADSDPTDDITAIEHHNFCEARWTYTNTTP